MRYNVIDILTVGKNTVVSLDGPREGLRNDISVWDENGTEYTLLSVAMMGGVDPSQLTTTDVLIKGTFNSKVIEI